MSIPRSKKPQRSKALPKPERADGPCCTGCGKAVWTDRATTGTVRAEYQMNPLFPDITPIEYACSKACYDQWIARDPSRGSKTKAKWS